MASRVRFLKSLRTSLLTTTMCLLGLTSLTGGRSSETLDSTMLFTLAEMCLPLSTDLINNVPVVNTPNGGPLSANSGLLTCVTRKCVIRRKKKEKDIFNLKGPCRVHEVFRRPDGSCNSPGNKGQIGKGFDRLLPADYQDKRQAPRSCGVNNQPLTSPRTVSLKVHPDQIAPTDRTIFLMTWGQFIDHDITSTPQPIENTRNSVMCCGENNGPPPSDQNSECLPILFPFPDPDFKGSCMGAVRSQPVTYRNGRIRIPREQINVVTSFLDASDVYGSTSQRLERLRDPDKPYLLKVTKTPKGDFLPDNGLGDCIKRNNTDDICFLAGDDRVNEQPSLTMLHVVFVRYHNILAEQLRHILFGTGTVDSEGAERIFQTVRAVVGAVVQNIHYSEYLSIILGPHVRREHDLDFEDGARTRHDPTVDPRIFNSFSAAAFRFGHSEIPPALPISPDRIVPLSRLFFKPFEARENLDSLVKGMLHPKRSSLVSQNRDRFFTDQVSKRLFEEEQGNRMGFDLVAVNINRGRDHGLPSYNAFRRKLGLKPIKSFNDSVLGTAGPKLAQVYDNVEDIDLFSGGISEVDFDGGGLGETFSKMVALQFQRLKLGDRFFFTNKKSGFTNRQVRLLRKVRLSHLLCLATNVDPVNPDVFTLPEGANKKIPCKKLLRNHINMGDFVNFPEEIKKPRRKPRKSSYKRRYFSRRYRGWCTIG